MIIMDQNKGVIIKVNNDCSMVSLYNRDNLPIRNKLPSRYISSNKKPRFKLIAKTEKVLILNESKLLFKLFIGETK